MKRCGSLCEAVYPNPSDPCACSACMERVNLCLSEKGKGQKTVLCEVICVNSLFCGNRVTAYTYTQSLRCTPYIDTE